MSPAARPEEGSPPAVQTPKPMARLRPSLLGALRAAWLFAWKTELTLRRVPVLLLGVLVLPALVYITTSSPAAWARRQVLLGNPAWELEGFSRRLAHSHNDLSPSQRNQLLAIFEEEYGQTETRLREAEARQASESEKTAMIRESYQRIRQRTREVLDNRQFGLFGGFQNRLFEEAKRRAATPRWKRTGPFYHWLIDFYFFVLLPLNCVRVSGAMIRDELQADTLGFLITRPLSRATLLVAKYISQTVWLQMVAILEVLLLFLVGSLREIPGLWTLLPLFLGVQFLAVLAWSALGALLGLTTQRYMAVAVVYGLIVEMGIGRIPTNINTLSLTRHLKTLLSRSPALQNVYDWSQTGLPLSIGALLFACGLFLTLAALLFTFREYHHTAEMQK